MLDYKKISDYIAQKRKRLGMTQADVAEKLNISFQAVSKWENGTLPGAEALVSLSNILRTSVDEILAGQDKSAETFSYSKAGVDISYTDSIKREMAEYLKTDDARVLNGLGPFASLYDISFPGIEEPVLVLKSEEPGSKQKLAMEYGYGESVCHDMINHLVNDIAVMGAKPLAVLDTIVCGRAEKETIKTFIKGMSESCVENECSLVGGETSIQLDVVSGGTYILTASVAGIVPRAGIIDGSGISEKDVVLGVASNGLHTNGYTLVRLLMEKMPQIKLNRVAGETFVEQIMKPHCSYYKAIKPLFGNSAVHGMAHITGGGIEGNLARIIPQGLCAEIYLDRIKTLPIFSYIKEVGFIPESEMLSTFNCGIGLIVVVEEQFEKRVAETIQKNYDCYKIGEIKTGDKRVVFKNNILW
ncbi:MAG: phosphoribosylformylglycinamidine cyclo-ligase [Oscillospiraceae bacterium]|nr:phosphoribosylformylglycinamidine cyclo-ligase [Oscillospiraceae bacterium]